MIHPVRLGASVTGTTITSREEQSGIAEAGRLEWMAQRPGRKNKEVRRAERQVERSIRDLEPISAASLSASAPHRSGHRISELQQGFLTFSPPTPLSCMGLFTSDGCAH